MRLGYELSNSSTVHSIATVHCVLQKRYGNRTARLVAVSSLSWSSLYIVQDSLLLENLLVITEWISSQTTLTASLEILSAIASPTNRLIEVVNQEDHFTSITLIQYSSNDDKDDSDRVV